MKKVTTLIFTCIIPFIGIFAQEQQKRFFFKNFQDTYVYYTDGRSFCISANYDLVKGSFVFIDKQDNNQLKYFGEQDKISQVKVGERTFLSSRFGPTEVVQTHPEFKVYYKPRLLDVGKSSGYGITSNTSATRTLSHMSSYGGGIAYFEKETKFVYEIKKIYIIKKNDRDKQFSTPKQFLKLYGKHKEELQKYITTNNIDFNIVMQVLELYNYAEGLPR